MVRELLRFLDAHDPMRPSWPVTGNGGVYVSVGAALRLQRRRHDPNVVSVAVRARERFILCGAGPTSRSVQSVPEHRHRPRSRYDERGKTVSTRATWSRNSVMKPPRKAAVASLVTSPSSVNTSGENWM
jgi:hypothetical protein